MRTLRTERHYTIIDFSNWSARAMYFVYASVPDSPRYLSPLYPNFFVFFNHITYFLSNLEQRVLCILGHCSIVLSVVPKRSVFGPILLVLFVNVIPEVANATVELYAEDTTIVFFLLLFIFYCQYDIRNMSCKIQYIIMHLFQSKHTLSLFLRFALISFLYS